MFRVQHVVQKFNEAYIFRHGAFEEAIIAVRRRTGLATDTY